MSYLRGICLTILATAVALYVLAVCWHVETVSQIGIDFLLGADRDGSASTGREIALADIDPERDLIGPAPRAGDRLLQFAGSPVHSLLDFKRDLNSWLQRASGAGQGLPEVAESAALCDLPGTAAVVGEDLWVQVAYRPAGEPAGVERTAWLRLRPAPRSGPAVASLWLVLAASLLGLGLVMVIRRPGDPSAAMYCALCAVSVVTFLGIFHWSSLVGNPWLVYPLIFCGLLLAPLTLHLYLLFPRPMPVVRRHRWLTLPVVYAPAVTLMGLFLANLIAIERDYASGGGSIARRLGWLASLIDVALWLSLIWFAAGLAVLFLRLRRSRAGVQRRQVRWLTIGVLATLVPVGYLVYAGLTDRSLLAFGAGSRWMVGLACLLLTTTHALALTRYKLVPLGALAFRGAWYLGISLAATALYCALVGALAPLAGKPHFHWLDAVVAGLTALSLVVLWGWFRDRFQRVWDRRYLVYKHQLDKSVRRLSAAVDHLVESSQLAKQMLQSARDVVAVERGAVYLLDPEGAQLKLSARLAWPTAPEFLHRQSPLTHALHRLGVVSARMGLAQLPNAAQLELRDLEGEIAFPLEREGLLVGLLVLGPKSDGSGYSSEERNFLAALVRTTALALRSAEENRTIQRLKEDLQTKVSKIAEQQQRISFLQAQLLRRSPSDRQPPVVASGGSEDPPPLATEIRGSSRAVRQMLDQVRKIAVSSSSVLIRGESGTGKELLALAIHRNSPRAQGPFVPVHCAALSAGLLEAELFGHVKGAFTGADRDRPGRFELAHGGTLFLDEIGDIALDTQIKLLRVLQERAIERVGSAQRVATDVRLIAATHQDLESLIRRGRFREDLFYRLNVISIRCPALRERSDDIFELAVGFLEEYAQRAGKHMVRVDEEALDALAAYDWPGNVRQLENTIERAVVLAEGESISLADLPAEILSVSGAAARPTRRRTGRREAASVVRLMGEASADTGLDDELEALERQRLIEVLEACGGNKSSAARKLGIPRSTLFSKLVRLGLAESRS